jgi:hypothetical protein
MLQTACNRSVDNRSSRRKGSKQSYELTCACARPIAANSTQKKAFKNSSKVDLQKAATAAAAATHVFCLKLRAACCSEWVAVRGSCKWAYLLLKYLSRYT